jgi:CPA2 family monovalent cation:H+ antiporter-2
VIAALATAAMPAFLPEMVALFTAGAAIAYVCYRLGLVPIAGFLVAGLLIGPHGLGLVRDAALVDAAAEVGVILLLFTIGIEFSMEKLARLRRLILIGGTLQVGLASVVTLGILALLGVSWPSALFTGFLVSLSSTAIVLKLVGDRGEARTPQSQVALGLLLFQDLAVVLMVLLVPMLAGKGEGAAGLASALGKALVMVAVVAVAARRLMPRLLERVARTCSPPLFLLTLVAVCFGTAWLASLSGVSLSLGAFLAGLLVSESAFSQHALGEILPLEILFSAAFFVSVGMLLDLGFLASHLGAVAVAIVTVLVVKVLTTAVAARALGYSGKVAAAAGLMLAQVGEFSFVLERAGRDAGLSPAGLGPSGSQAFIAATVVLMVATPALVAFGSRIARGTRAPEGSSAAPRSEGGAADGEAFAHLRDHVIVAGYGQAARRLVGGLQDAAVPFVVTTLSPGGANEAEASEVPVLRGDYAKRHTLQRARVEDARTLVIADDDPAMVERVIAVARGLHPGVHTIVRTRYLPELQALGEGIDRVVADEMEGAVRLLEEVLGAQGLSPEAIHASAAALRERAGQEGAPGGSPAPGSQPCGFDAECTMELKAANAAGCTHLAQVRKVTPGTRGCEECLRTGDRWVHLRLCMTCGHVGCCDSSKNKHATKHFRATEHPIVRSLEPGDEWGWCYVDEVML